jgi:hypothetical protein
MEHALVLRGKCVRANMRCNLGQTVPARAGDPTADTLLELLYIELATLVTYVHSRQGVQDIKPSPLSLSFPSSSTSTHQMSKKMTVRVHGCLLRLNNIKVLDYVLCFLQNSSIKTSMCLVSSLVRIQLSSISPPLQRHKKLQGPLLCSLSVVS